jgi:hypothetical protein
MPLCPASAGCRAIGGCPGARSPRKPIPHPRSLPPAPNGDIAGAGVSFTAVPHGAAGRRPPSLAVVLAPLSSGDSRMLRASANGRRSNSPYLHPR